ncbi:hypothetical protein LAT59_03645 [Candidatus Gracilibacteria bacterium]|nr:hypothetical protein [Candidatus Gracilibacteria bacterium]
MNEEKEILLHYGINRINFLKNEYLKSNDENIKFILIQDLIIIYYELISSKSINNFFDQKNINDNSIFKFFYLLRHFFVHYPYFSKIEDIVISKEKLKTSINGKNNNSSLIKYLEEKHLPYQMKSENTIFNIELPQLINDNDEIILKNIITIIDSGGYRYSENDKIYFIIRYLELIFQKYLDDNKSKFRKLKVSFT